MCLKVSGHVLNLARVFRRVLIYLSLLASCHKRLQRSFFFFFFRGFAWSGWVLCVLVFHRNLSATLNPKLLNPEP